MITFTLFDFVIFFCLMCVAVLFSGFVRFQSRRAFLSLFRASRQRKFSEDFERRCAVIHARNVRLQEGRNSQS